MCGECSVFSVQFSEGSPVWGSSSVIESGRDHCRGGLRFGVLNRELLVMTSIVELDF